VVIGGGHVSFGMGFNILLTSRTLGPRKKGARRPNNSSRDVASPEKPGSSQTFFDFRVLGFVKEGPRGSSFHLVNLRVASKASS
jgi:hypothetical protein